MMVGGFECTVTGEWRVVRRLDWLVPNEIWELLELLKKYPYAMFQLGSVSAEQYVNQPINVADLLDVVPDADWVTPRNFPSADPAAHPGILVKGINCLVVAQAVLHRLGITKPRGDLSSHIYEKTLSGVEYVSVDLTDVRAGDIVLFQNLLKARAGRPIHPAELHQAVVVGFTSEGIPLVVDALKRRDASLPAVGIRAVTGYRDHKVVGIFRRVGAGSVLPCCIDHAQAAEVLGIADR